MGNSVTGPGARLDAENSNLQAYCDRLEAENEVLREQLAAAPGATLAGGTMTDAITNDQLVADLARWNARTSKDGLYGYVGGDIHAKKIADYLEELRAARARIAELEAQIADGRCCDDYTRLPSCGHPNCVVSETCEICVEIADRLSAIEQERDALAQRLAQAEQLLADAAQALPDCSGPITHRVQTLRQYWTKENADLRRQLEEAREWIRRFRDAEWDDTLRRMQFQAGDYLREQDRDQIVLLATARRVEGSHE